MSLLAGAQNSAYNFRAFADPQKTIHGPRLGTSTLTEASETRLLFPFVSPGTMQHVAHSRRLTNVW